MFSFLYLVVLMCLVLRHRTAIQFISYVSILVMFVVSQIFVFANLSNVH